MVGHSSLMKWFITRMGLEMTTALKILYFVWVEKIGMNKDVQNVISKFELNKYLFIMKC